MDNQAGPKRIGANLLKLSRCGGDELHAKQRCRTLRTCDRGFGVSDANPK